MSYGSVPRKTSVRWSPYVKEIYGKHNWCEIPTKKPYISSCGTTIHGKTIFSFVSY